MADEFSNIESVISQGRNAVAVTASAEELDHVPKALWISETGDITGIAADDTVEVTFANVPVGVFDIVRFKVISACPANTIAAY